jgi:PBSX family phage portal protein
MATRIEEDNVTPDYEVSISNIELDDDSTVLIDVFNTELEGLKHFVKNNRNIVRRIDTRIKSQNDEIKKAEANPKSKQIVLTENAYSLFDVIEPPYNLATLARLYEASAPNYAAINAKVSHLVGLGYDFETDKSIMSSLDELADDTSRQKRLKKIDKAKFAMKKWLDSVCEDRSFVDVMNKVVIDLEATGAGYIEVGRTVRGDVGYIGHIPSHTIRVRRAKDGYVQMADGRAVYFAKFGESSPSLNLIDTGAPNELIQIKKFTPTNTYYGVPDIVSAKESAYGLIAANSYNLDYFNNKGVPRYVVSIEGAKLDARSEKSLLEFLRGLKGNHHRTIVVPLPANPATGVTPKLKFDAVESDIQEGSFTKYKTQSRDEILMAHRTPANKVAATGDSSLANSRELDRSFKEQVIRPQQELIESKVNWIIEEKTDLFKLTFNEFTLTDEDTQSQIDERDLRMGALLPNERRSKLGLPPHDEGNTPVQLTAQQKADQAATARQSRTRDANRSANASDTQGDSRNPQGEGRRVP